VSVIWGSEASLTADSSSGLPAELAGWPTYTLTDAQLGDLELLTSGVFAPLQGFMTAADLVTLDVPADAAPADRLVLQDHEGSPLAVLSITERLPLSGDLVRLAGPVAALRAPEHGPFRQLRRRPEEVREELAGGNVLAYATRRPLNGRHIGQLRYYASQLNARLLLLPLVAGPTELVGSPEALVRAVVAAGQHLPASTLVIPVPLGQAGLHAEAIVAAAYGATHLLADSPAPGLAIPVVNAGEWAYDPRSEVWRPLALIEPGAERAELTDSELGELLDAGAEVPAWFAPESVARELRRIRPPRAERGLAVFFTGLSGSGKSTIARGLAEALAERGDRTVSLLDGDQVRRLLSAGLTFSRADRDLNIARIGYVAAEVARHGGIAICAPIAPYAQARAMVRDMVTQVGDFLLVYVATPLEVCAARDRKGLYAKAQAGLIKDFTGVSDPYEEPRDADLVLDTSVMTRAEAVSAVLKLLISGGWLAEPRTAAGRTGARHSPAVRRLG
jgi:sulfate adenylyltransferase